MPLERRIQIHQVDRIVDGSRVADFDELSEGIQQALYGAIADASSGHAETSVTVDREFEQYDVIRFTEYYAVDTA